MKLKTFRGGIHPPELKGLTENKPLEKCALPNKVIIPLQQHTGSPAEPVVKVGDKVLAGQKICDLTGFISAAHHASISGEVTYIGPAPHPLGRKMVAVEITSDGNIISGLQIINFPNAAVGLRGGAQNNIIGGDRSIGSGSLGQGNLTSGNTFGIGIWDEGTDFNIELEKLPKYCSMGLQHVLTDTHGAVGNDTVQFAVITFLRAGSNDWTVNDPKFTIKNLVLEFDKSLPNRSSPMVLMNVETSLLNETQYIEWMDIFNPPRQEIQVYDPTVRSIVEYDTANKTNLTYGLIFNVWITNSDGLDDIANVTVTYPDGTVIPLKDEGDGWGYHPAGDGEYFNVADINYTITGTFTFKASDDDGNSAQTTAILGEWLKPFDWVRPASQEIVNITETNLTFNSSDTILQNFTINLGNATVKEGFWSVASNSTQAEYDGDTPLLIGEYWWTLSAESEKSNKIQAFTEFEIIK